MASVIVFHVFALAHVCAKEPELDDIMTVLTFRTCKHRTATLIAFALPATPSTLNRQRYQRARTTTCHQPMLPHFFKKCLPAIAGAAGSFIANVNALGYCVTLPSTDVETSQGRPHRN